MKILITGASGFVGQHLLKDIASTDYSIRVMTRNASKKMGVMSPKFEVIEADLTDVESLRKACAGVDTIINAAAEIRNDNKLKATNINGTVNLIQAAIENKVSKIIHLSSVGVVGMQYSGKSKIINEESECTPKNEYEKTKLESERLLVEAQKKYNFQLVILRPTNVYGEYHPYNALLHFMQHIKNKKMLVFTPNAMVNYVYVKDLTFLIIFLLNRPEQGVFNVGNSMLLSEFSHHVAVLTGEKLRSFILPGVLANFINYCGGEKIQPVANRVEYTDKNIKTYFQYPFGMEQGLKNTIEHYKKLNLLK